MGEAKARGTQEERVAEAKLKNTLTPPVCPACGLDPKNDEEMAGFEGGFLCFPIPNMGVAHFTCPRCMCLMMNTEAFEVQKLAREEHVKRSKAVSVNAAGRTPGGLVLPGR